MPRNFRQSQFRRKEDVGEDVNPSAYIVNLADCMLVLACGFLVAVISAFDMDLSNLEQVDAEQMEEVDQQAVSPEDIENGGGYVAAGTVYMDPQTGVTYWIKDIDVDAASSQDGSDQSSADVASGASDAGESAGGASGGAGSGSAKNE